MSDIATLVDEGLTFIERKNYDAAEQCFRVVIERDPTEVAGYLNLGCILWHRKDLPGAAALIETALTLQPTNAEVQINLGVLYAEQDLLDQALGHVLTGLRLKPSSYGYCNLGVLYRRLGLRERSLQAFDEALTLEPGDWMTHLNRANELLVLGRFAEGWDEYEYRLGFTDVYGSYPIGQDAVRWTGEFVEHLLIHYEQGFGDTIQSSRYIIAASQRCKRLTFMPQPMLLDLMQASFADRPNVTVTDIVPESYDAYQWIDSLPRIFKSGIERVPGAPYVSVPRSAPWQQCMARLPGLKVGLMWAGRPDALIIDKRRSMQLSAFDQLLGLPGISFVSLQQHRSECDPRLHDAAPHLYNWSDTAALMQELDLVISVDTAAAHLAGALGKPVWLLNRFDTCWRWELGRSGTRWYPTMRIFRQPHAGDWQAVLRDVQSELVKLANI